MPNRANHPIRDLDLSYHNALNINLDWMLGQAHPTAQSDLKPKEPKEDKNEQNSNNS